MVRFLRRCARGAAALVGVLLLLRFVAGSSLLPAGWILDGFDYLPPWALAVLVIPCVLACWALREPRVALAVATAFLALVIVHDDFSFRRGPRPSQAPVVNVATINVQYYRHGRERVVEAIKSMDADVVLLSENAVRPDQVPQLQALFAPLHFYAGRPEETAIVSREPLREVKEVELPSFQASLRAPNRFEVQRPRAHRSFLHAQLEVGGVPVHLISIRFIAGRPPSKRLADQLRWGRYVVATHHEEGRFFLDYLSRLRGPIIFGGDLNAPPSARLIQGLNEVAQDAWWASHWWGKPTFSVDAPLLRLDYLFGANGAVPVESVRLALRVSDHYPVAARFAVLGSADPGERPSLSQRGAGGGANRDTSIASATMR